MASALVICCQYPQFPNARLFGCYNDGDNFIKCLRKINPKIDITLMRDDLPVRSNLYPSRFNILNQLNKFILSRNNTLYFYFSGHGTSVNDFNKDEMKIMYNDNGKQIVEISSLLQDSCIVTNDNRNLNIVLDDEFGTVLSRLKPTQTLYGFMDSCHSGTGFDLYKVYMGQYNEDFTSNNITELLNQINNNCSIIEGDYPDKNNRVKANCYLISGTRDNSYSFEANINGKPGGFFTDAICKILDNGVKNINLKQFYLLLIAMVNNKEQIPVLTCSKNVNLDKISMNDFNYNSKQKPKLFYYLKMSQKIKIN
jgi:hypothetical protein